VGLAAQLKMFARRCVGFLKMDIPHPKKQPVARQVKVSSFADVDLAGLPLAVLNNRQGWLGWALYMR